MLPSISDFVTQTVSLYLLPPSTTKLTSYFQDLTVRKYSSGSVVERVANIGQYRCFFHVMVKKYWKIFPSTYFFKSHFKIQQASSFGMVSVFGPRAASCWSAGVMGMIAKLAQLLVVDCCSWWN